MILQSELDELYYSWCAAQDAADIAIGTRYHGDMVTAAVEAKRVSDTAESQAEIERAQRAQRANGEGK